MVTQYNFFLAIKNQSISGTTQFSAIGSIAVTCNGSFLKDWFEVRFYKIN